MSKDELAGVLRQAMREGHLIAEGEARNLMVGEMNRATDALVPSSMVLGPALYGWLVDPAFRGALRQQSGVVKMLETYGPPTGWAALEADGHASAQDIASVSGTVETMLTSPGSGRQGLLLLANDVILAMHQPELEKMGFSFLPGWRQPDSLYHIMLSAALTYGREFGMRNNGIRWDAVEKTATRPEYPALSLLHL